MNDPKVLHVDQKQSSLTLYPGGQARNRNTTTRGLLWRPLLVGTKKSLLHPISTVTNWTKNPLPLVHQALLQQKHYYIMDCNRILSCSKGKYILDGQLHDNFCVFVWIIICWVYIKLQAVIFSNECACYWFVLRTFVFTVQCGVLNVCLYEGQSFVILDICKHRTHSVIHTKYRHIYLAKLKIDAYVVFSRGAYDLQTKLE